MKAYVYRRYGGPEVLELVDVPKPVIVPIQLATMTIAVNMGISMLSSFQ